jgi:endonuclease/exonuclease/phosphatase family metal-dependent hydrolase
VKVNTRFLSRPCFAFAVFAAIFYGMCAPASAIVRGYEPAPDDLRFDAVAAFSITAWLATGHNHFGNATLIAPGTVLFASHLLPSASGGGYRIPNPGEYSVRFRRQTNGVLGKTSDGSASFHQVRIMSYAVPASGDLSLGFLEFPVEHIQPIAPLLNREPHAGDPLILAGWGKIGPGFDAGDRGWLRLADARANSATDSTIGYTRSTTASNWPGANMFDSGGAVIWFDAAGEPRLAGTMSSTSGGTAPWNYTLGPGAGQLTITVWQGSASLPELPEDVSVPTNLWTHAPGVPAPWMTAANWIGGRPAVTTYRDSHLDNGGIARIGFTNLAVANRLFIGYRDRGLIRHDDGNLDVYSASSGRGEGLWLGFYPGASGAYVLDNGVLTSPVDVIGHRGTGHFLQRGGSNLVFNSVYLGYQPDGHGTYVIEAGTLHAQNLNIGYRGEGVFRQLGGAVSGTWQTVLGDLPGGHGIMTLFDGDAVTENLTVGRRGIGEFVLHGGAYRATSNLVIATYPGSVGTVRFDGPAQVQAVHAAVGPGGNGVVWFNHPGATMSLSRSFTLHPGGALPAGAGGALRIGSMGWINAATHPAQTEGLSTLQVSLHGGSVTSPAPFEIAGADVGPFPGGLIHNMAFGHLRIGDAEEPAQARLVNAIDNHPRFGTGEVQYVRHLTIGPGSTLDLNGHTLYYQTLVNQGEVILNGGRLRSIYAAPSFLIARETEGEGAIRLIPERFEYRRGTPVSAAPEPAPGWRFERWEGDFSGTNTPLTWVVDTPATLVAVFVPEEMPGASLSQAKGAPPSFFSIAPYTVTFEGATETKTAYASGSVTLSGLSWNLTEVLIGTLDADWKTGVRSARLRGYGASAMTLLDPLTNGLGAISFGYRRYGSDAQVSWRVEYNINGGPWVQAGTDFTGAADVRTFTATVHTGGLVRVRIRTVPDTGTSNRRLNIDDIVLTPFDEGAPPVKQPPLLAPIGDHLVARDASLSFGVYATATDGDPVALTATDLPLGASFTSSGATGQFTWASASPLGVYTSSFFAADVDGVATQQSVITVSTTEYQMVIMAANLSEQTGECETIYGGPATRMFQGLKPDIVGIQEWNVTNAGGHRAYVNAAFGTNFSFYVEPSYSCAMPNGIISRWPILQSGYWWDSEVGNRNFAWAVVDIPGDTDLRVVSVHFKAGSTATDILKRENQARALTNYLAQVPTNQYIVLAGDLNIWSASEAGYTILRDRLNDDSKPTDRFGNRNTNIPQNRRYDYVLPDARLQLAHRTLSVDGQNFPHGLVFESSQWSPPPAPILSGDAKAPNIQHLPVMKAYTLLEAPPALNTPPVITLNPAGAAKSVESGSLLAFNVIAAQAGNDLDETVVYAGLLPPGAIFPGATGTPSASASFTWTPAVTGLYAATFFAADKDGVATQHVQITVIAPPPPPPATTGTVLVVYGFDASTNAPDAVAANLTASTFLPNNDRAISYFSGNGSPSAISATGWDVTNRWWEITLDIAPGYALAVTNLQFDSRSSGTGPTAWFLTSSTDNHAAALTAANVAANSNFQSQSAPLALLNLTGSVALRLHGHAASGSGGTWRIDNFRLTGAVLAAATNVSFVSSARTVEENAGSIAVAISKTIPEGNVTGQIQLGGTATLGVDYTLSATNFALSGTNLVTEIFITIIDDGLAEPDETIILTLANVSGAAIIAPSVFTVTILDNDLPTQPPLLDPIGPHVVSATGTLSFTVSATPTDGDPASLIASNLPPGAIFSSSGPTGTFTWAAPAASGIYTTRFFAVDKDGYDVETVLITRDAPPGPPPGNLWINEIHYRNLGDDVDEGFEVAGAAGLDLSAYRIVLYHGLTYSVASNRVLSGMVPDQGQGFGAVWIAFDHVGDGPNDAVALVYENGGTTSVVQLISWDGQLTAVDGPAQGLTSTDIGVQQPAANPVGQSLALCGTGNTYPEHLNSGGWQPPAPHSRGALNPCQTFPGQPLPTDFTLDALAGSSLPHVIALPSQIGVIYTLQYATNLMSSPVTWQDMQDIPGDGQTLQFEDQTPPNLPFRAYRVKAQWDTPSP